MEAFSRANELFVDDELEKAIAAYDEAIAADSTQANFFLKRSAAHLKLQHLEEAASDCRAALALSANNPKAQGRLGQILNKQGKHAEAAEALQAAQKLGDTSDETAAALAVCKDHLAHEAAAQKKAAPPPIRHEFYQNDSQLVVTVYAKKVELCEVTIAEQQLDVHIRQTGRDEDFRWSVPLLHPIDAAASTWKQMSTKVEIVLRKRAALAWPKLERDPDAAAASVPMAASAADANPVQQQAAKARNWDQIVKEEEETEKPEGEEAMMKLFKQIFRDGTPEQQKAMMKSFSESGGTVLSTNWDDVKKGKVEVKPPEGTEFKKWDK